MTSSELPELLAVSDRIIVLCEGRLTAEIPRASATEEAIMHAATAFLDRSEPGKQRISNELHSSTNGDHHAFAPVFVSHQLRPWLFDGRRGQPPKFQAQEIDPHVGDICYAVTVADVNGDRKLDVVAVTEDAVVWYENPSWRKARHRSARRRPAITSASSRTTSTATAGSISRWEPAGVRPIPKTRARSSGWAATGQGRWQVHPIHFDEPTLHRLRWGDVKGTGKKQLVVAPLQGRGTKGPDWGAGEGVRVAGL